MFPSLNLSWTTALCQQVQSNVWQIPLTLRGLSLFRPNLTFRQGDYSAHGIFGKGHFGTWIYWHGNLSAQGHLGTGTFWHIDILAKWKFQHSNTFLHRCQNVCAKMSVPKHPYCFAWCQNFPVPKRLCAKMSLCQKVSMLKCPLSPHRNVPVMKCPCRNVSCWNVRFRNKPKPLRIRYFKSSIFMVVADCKTEFAFMLCMNGTGLHSVPCALAA